MSKNLNNPNQENLNSPTNSKKKSSKIRYYISFLLFCAIVIFGYISYEDYKFSSQREKLRIKDAQKEVEQYDNIGSEIFDLDALAQKQKMPKLTPQEKIAFLEKKVEDLEQKILVIKDRDKAQRIIISYVTLRQKIFFNPKQDFAYFENLQELESLVKDDEFLKSKIIALKVLLPNSPSREELLQKYFVIIDKLIINENRAENSTMLQKVWHNLRKLVIVRKVDKFEEGEETLDAKIAQVENALKNYQYKEAQSLLLEFDAKYEVTLSAFMLSLKNFLEIRNIDREILEHLKNND